MKILRIICLVLLLVLSIVSMYVYIPLIPFKIAVVGLLLLGATTYYFEGLYRLEDLPFLFLLVGTFVFGKAFSLLGFTVAGIPIYATELLLFISLGLVFLGARKALANWKQSLPPGMIVILLFYVAIGTIYLLVGLKTRGSMAFRDVVFCHYALLTFVAVNVLDNREKFKSLLPMFIPGVVLLIVIGILRNFVPPVGGVAILRFTSATKAFNWALIYGLIALVVLTFYAFKEKENFTRKHKIAEGFLIYLGLLFVVMSDVRASWAGLIIALVFLWIFLKKEIKVMIIILPVLVVSVFVIDYVFERTKLLAKLSEEVESLLPGAERTYPKMNIIFRMRIWNQTLDKIKEKPLLGWGFGSFPRYIVWGKEAPQAKGLGPGSMVIPPHNHLLAIFYKMGIVGLAFFIVINLWVFLVGVGYIKTCRDPFNRRFLIAVLAGFVYWHGVAFFFDVLESPPTGIFLWILLGCIMGIVHIDKNGDPRNTRNTRKEMEEKGAPVEY
ncbi:MAG: O-antigen ligase family protein [Candidatus Aminicenantes bacterium]|nr:O-antigen ligase family protein [Candidatus Aminicenantes bacterium]